MMPSSVSSDRAEVADARPILPRDPSSVWSRAAADRLRVKLSLEEAAAKHMPQAMVIASNEGIYPIWVRLEHWLRMGSTSERIHLKIDILPRPHRKYPLEYQLTIDNRGRTTKKYTYGELSSQTIAQMLSQLSADRHHPASTHRLRSHPWMLWWPRNRTEGVSRDLVKLARNIAGILAAAAFLFGSVGEAIVSALAGLRETLKEIIEVGYLGFWVEAVISAAAVAAAVYVARTWPRNAAAKWAIAAACLVCFVFQPGGIAISLIQYLELMRNDDLNLWDWLFWISLPLFVILFVFDRRRSQLVYNEGRPTTEPRILFVADYWHGVLDGIGSARDLLRQRFISAFDEGAHQELRISPETLVSLGPDGKEEREQIVLSFRRAIIYCQFYPYGRNLYVGWDAYLNIGQWKEQEVGRGMQSLGMAISIRSVEPAVQVPSEYDIHDLNCLIEWTHSRLTKLVRAVAAEYALDQELNFSIQRVEREALMSSGEDSAAQRRSKRIQRTG